MRTTKALLSRSIPAFAGTTRITAAALATLAVAAIACSDIAHAADAPKGKTMADMLAASKPADWRTLDPDNTLYLDLAAGRVIIELAPAFAPLHAKNIRTLAHEHYFDGLAILRVQDNFVTQWGDPDSDKPDKAQAARHGVEDARAGVRARDRQRSCVHGVAGRRRLRAGSRLLERDAGRARQENRQGLARALLRHGRRRSRYRGRHRVPARSFTS